MRGSLNEQSTLPSVPTMIVNCARCGSPAGTFMSFAYVDRAVWLDDLIIRDDAHGYALCADHADRMTPPLGWTLTDRRTVTRLFAPLEVA